MTLVADAGLFLVGTIINVYRSLKVSCRRALALTAHGCRCGGWAHIPASAAAVEHIMMRWDELHSVYGRY